MIDNLNLKTKPEPREYIVDALSLSSGESSLLYDNNNHKGKTTLVSDIATSVSTGSNFLDQEVTEKKCLFLTNHHNSVMRRVRAYAEYHRIDESKIEKNLLLTYYDNFQNIDALFTLIKNNDIGLVIFDDIQTRFNDADIQRIITKARRLGITSLLVFPNEPKAKIKSLVDSAFLLSMEKDSNNSISLTLTNTKQRDRALIKEKSLKLSRYQFKKSNVYTVIIGSNKEAL